MIKIALAATCAFALTAGAAFAQEQTLGAQSTANNATTATQPTDPATTGATGATLIANTPAGDAPSTYPMCTHRGQDRCMQHHPRR